MSRCLGLRQKSQHMRDVNDYTEEYVDVLDIGDLNLM